MNNLEKLLEKRKIKEEKKAERERIKQEKIKEKEEIKRKKHKQRLRKSQNKRAYAKIKKARLDERNKKGDYHSYHMILITKNNKRVSKLGSRWWKTDAFELYNKAIKENREQVKYPKNFAEVINDSSMIKLKYEIMIVQRNLDEDNITKFRNDDGEFVDNIIIDNSKYKIIAKDDWFIEETFNVYGYHPKKNRKTFDFILNEIVLKNCSINNIKRIFIYNNKLVIHYDNDFDFVVCKTSQEADRLYDALQKGIGKQKYIYFTGHLSKSLSSKFLDEMEEKTGWARNTCKRIHSL